MKLPLRLSLFLAVAAAIVFTAGCNTSTSKKKKDYDITVARFFLEAKENDAFASVTLPISGVQIAINNKPVFTEMDYAGVSLARSDLGQFLLFQLTADASRELYRTTGNNQGRRLVLFINDKPVGARMIDRTFSSGSIAIFAAIVDEDLPAIVKNLNLTSIDIQKDLAKASR